MNDIIYEYLCKAIYWAATKLNNSDKHDSKQYSTDKNLFSNLMLFTKSVVNDVDIGYTDRELNRIAVVLVKRDALSKWTIIKIHNV